MALTIKTNSVPRNYSYGSDFTGKERQEMLEQLDYLTEEDFNISQFINYKGYWYDLSQFLFTKGDSELENLGWEGYCSDSFFSGVVVRYVENDETTILYVESE